MKLTFVLLAAFTSTPVSIGLQQTQYTSLDTADYQFVCAETQSGIVGERHIEIQCIVTNAGMIVQLLHRDLFMSITIHITQYLYDFYKIFFCNRHNSPEWHSVVY